MKHPSKGSTDLVSYQFSYQSEQIWSDLGDPDLALQSQNHVTAPQSIQLITRRSRVRVPPPLCENPLKVRGFLVGSGR
jgi:hypothetical protein